MWLLPTRERPANLRRFFMTSNEMGTGSPGLVLINKSDWAKNAASYEELRPLLPKQWAYETVEAECYGDALRAIWPRVKDLDWVGLVADDLVPASMNWDKLILQNLTGFNFVSALNGAQDHRMHGATAWSGPLLREIGWLFPPELRHIFHDDIWETIGRETGMWKILPNVMTKHLHETYLTGVRGPTMDPTSDLWKHDEVVFRRWQSEDKGRCLAAVKTVMDRYGVVQMKPDFTGVSLMIGTPCIDGKYEGSYMTSLFKTMRFLEQNNVPVMVAEEKYTADITAARNRIFASFVRSGCTHFLMIDADMGWEVDAIARLFCAKKDFVAIAGPKKKYPLQFAASHIDARGNPINLQFDNASGTMEVTDIGSAFAMLTRGAVDRLISVYGRDLKYTGIMGETEWNLFAPMIVNDRYYSEDFAFCRRWKATGGQVFMIPDVRLSHTGGHCFTGAFLEGAQLQPVPTAVPAQQAAE